MTLHLINLNENPEKWDQFYNLPGQVYGNDPYYCKVPIESVKKSVNRSEFEGKQLSLLVLDNNRAVARLVARKADNLVGIEKGTAGLFGFFEAENNHEAIKLLFYEGVNWFRKQGISMIIGPMDGDTWHKYRFNVGPFNSRPFMMEPYNPVYYPNLWEEYGFCVFAKYISKRVSDVEKILPQFERIYKRVEKGRFQIRRFRLSAFEDDLKILYDLSCRIFSNNHYYSEITEKDFISMYADSRAIINPNLVWFCLDKNMNYVGFIFSFPDYFNAARSMNGSAGLWAKLKFSLNRKKADILNIKTLGTTPECRGVGIGPALMYKVYSEGLKLGYNDANMCLIHEENVSSRMDGGKGDIFRYYHLYKYEIDSRIHE